MGIQHYLRILRRSWILTVALALAGLLVGAAVSLAVKPAYTSVTQLFVAIESSGSVQELQQGDSFGQARVQSYVRTVTTRAVLQPAIDSLGLPMTAGQLAPNVKASTDGNTVLITISVTDESPAQSAALAQAVANSLVKAVDALEKPKTGNASPITLSIVGPAEVPTRASSPDTLRNLLIGLVVGLILGVWAGMLQAALDNRIRSESDLRHVTSAPVLGGIALDTDAFRKPLLTQIDRRSPRAESLRQLRATLQSATAAGHTRSVLVTSSVPGEGKTTLAANLAIALAQDGQNVCLIDADLRRPTIGTYLGVNHSTGLTTALTGAADVNDLLQPTGTDRLYLLTSGHIPDNPSELLGSAAMKELILRLETAFDTVIIDAPPVLPVADATVLSRHVGGVLVVVNTQHIKGRLLARTFSALELVNANVLGVVLNRLPARGPDTSSLTYQDHPKHEAPTNPAPALEPATQQA